MLSISMALGSITSIHTKNCYLGYIWLTPGQPPELEYKQESTRDGYVPGTRVKRGVVKL
jgi:hypothetical protein